MKLKLYYFLLIALMSSCAVKQHTHDVIQNQESTLQTIDLSEGSTQKLSGSYVFVNQVAYEVKGALNETLNPILKNFNGKVVLIELNTTEYYVTEPIILPSQIQSRVTVNGNYATIKSSLDVDSFVFTKLGDYKFGTTGIADTYQEVRNLNIEGSGGAVHFQGGYQSKCINIKTKRLSKGIKYEFILQGKIDGCHFIHPKDYGISMTTIPGKGTSKTQCNMSIITDNRIVAKNTDKGIYINNSNNIRLSGNIIEGGDINVGLHFHNASTTCTNVSIIDIHFENSNYSKSCILLTGQLRQMFIERMYYSGIKGKAIISEAAAYSHIILENIAWTEGWVLETTVTSNDRTSATWWYFNNVRSSDFNKLFPGRKPYYVYSDGKNLKLKD